MRSPVSQNVCMVWLKILCNLLFVQKYISVSIKHLVPSASLLVFSFTLIAARTHCVKHNWTLSLTYMKGGDALTTKTHDIKNLTLTMEFVLLCDCLSCSVEGLRAAMEYLWPPTHIKY